MQIAISSFTEEGLHYADTKQFIRKILILQLIRLSSPRQWKTPSLLFLLCNAKRKPCRRGLNKTSFFAGCCVRDCSGNPFSWERRCNTFADFHEVRVKIRKSEWSKTQGVSPGCSVTVYCVWLTGIATNEQTQGEVRALGAMKWDCYAWCCGKKDCSGKPDPQGNAPAIQIVFVFCQH